MKTRVVVLLAVLMFISLIPVHAGTVTVTGTNGADATADPLALAVSGGSAYAEAISSDPLNTATATGGSGGRGIATSLGIEYRNSAPGGSAVAVATTNFTLGTSSSVAQASGGAGGPCWYDAASGAGGAAAAAADAFGGIGPAIATASATGGPAGFNADLGPRGAAGAATVAAFAGNTSSAPVTVSAVARGGRGSYGGYGYAGIGGGASFSSCINGESLGGGNVSVGGSLFGGEGGMVAQGTGGAGASVQATNQVDGSTSGDLQLTQEAFGGPGGFGGGNGGGAGGDAFSSLAHTGASRTLLLTVNSVGGDAGSDSSFWGPIVTGGTAGNGEGHADARNTAGPATAQTLARGGGGGNAPVGIGSGRGGDAVSTTSATTWEDSHAAVSSGSALGGKGSAYPESGGNAISDSTATAYGNSQVNVSALAVGGASANWSYDLPVAGGSASSSASGGNAGNSPVHVTATAIGGNGGDATAAVGVPLGGPGGSAAVTSAFGYSTGGGPVSVSSVQRGGHGGAGTGAGPGADSLMSNTVSGSTSGDLSLGQSATGGSGGNGGVSGGGAGGAASSVLAFSTIAQRLTGQCDAHGGIGGNSTGGQAGSGGNAIAHINLMNYGSVTSTAEAYGGSGGTGGTTSTRGTANAHSAAKGTLAIAHATGSGLTGSASAEAQTWTWGNLVMAFGATAGGPVLNSVTDAEARATIDQPAPASSALTGLHSAAFATAIPRTADSLAAIAGNPNVQAGFDVGGDTAVLSLIALQGAYSGVSSGTAQDYTASTSLSLKKLDTLTDLRIGLVNPQAGSNFDRLHFLIQREGTSLVDQTFTSPGDAQAYFQDHYFNFGSLWAGISEDNIVDLNISMTMTAHQPGDGFSAGVLVGSQGEVPEPSAFALLFAGGVGMVARKWRRKCRRAGG